jgi:hypothetical protein
VALGRGSKQGNILGLCGIGPIRETLIGSAGSLTAAEGERWLETIRPLGREARQPVLGL